MSDEVKPALTAAEWAAICVEGECRNDELWLHTKGWSIADPDERTVDDLDHHAIAAIALKDQPFGFTREDAKILNRIGNWLIATSVDAGDDEPADKEGWALLRIAARTEALLPPEAP